MINLNIFKNKKVMVTGHTGFKGSWLCIWLKELGADVIGYALDPYTSEDNFVQANISNKITDIRGDIRNYEKLENIFKKYNPEIVFHLAAQPIVKESYKSPKYTYDVNVGGTVNVLECCRKTESVKVIINVTSDKCYDNREWIWGYRENDPMGGYDPYSSSKGCSELITSSYRNSFFTKDRKVSLSSVRAGNVIGGGDWAINRIVPDCMRSLENQIPIEIRSPKAIRPWQHVLEPLGGYLALASKMLENTKNYSGAYNFGPNNSSIIPVKELVEKIIKDYGSGKLLINDQQSNEHEANLLSLDISKANFILGWNPVLDIDDAVKNTVAWYQQYQNNENVYNLCTNQIKNYMEKAIKIWK